MITKKDGTQSTEEMKIPSPEIMKKAVSYMSAGITKFPDRLDFYTSRHYAMKASKLNEELIIPMNMRDGSLICIGKGNSDWNYSAPHGAGRIMSRGKAKEAISLAEFEESMKGIYTTSVNENTIDESPMVYKPMQEIIDCIGDTVEIEKIIKPIYNFKAGE